MKHLLELARRHGRAHGHLLEQLRGGTPDAEVASEWGVRPAAIEGVRSFYDELHSGPASGVCTGTACWYAGGPPPTHGRGVRCLGRCYQAPCIASSPRAPIPLHSMVETPVVLRHLLQPNRDPMADYALAQGDGILDAVQASGLRGRGGAAYSTGAKWRVAHDTPASDRVVVANGDEGDPGSYVDRLILERDPHALLAGMWACARAIHARTGIVFVRGEYPEAARSVEEAVRQACERGLLGNDFDVSVMRGAGSYVAGEETALLRAIEGRRAEPSPKPPYPAESGLWGLPTVVQNIETLALIPWVLQHGRRPDTKAICLSGAVAQPGVIEVAFGTPLREVLEAAGGPCSGASWKLALVGGPMGRVLTEAEFDTPLSYEALPGMGHGGIVVFDSSLRIRDLCEHLFEFAASESCGSCTPCRLGTSQLAACTSVASLERLLDTLEMGSLCGFGSGVPRPLRDLVRHYGEEVLK